MKFVNFIAPFVCDTLIVIIDAKTFKSIYIGDVDDLCASDNTTMEELGEREVSYCSVGIHLGDSPTLIVHL